VPTGDKNCRFARRCVDRDWTKKSNLRHARGERGDLIRVDRPTAGRNIDIVN
jgi:hypothetical protein